ncbi:hypothetical protein [Hymenobacter sp. BRD67]|uniref:hypothetical protein n=1 Tax=Hymenobacter sp. BRD67 TaxID=2675877 RepID=UPI001565062D|nr:hypothetical protein [Hymenobacter sp. BRD67]QKG53477.1 hypothetical protein GKZ67_13825 [Hymenobacter sp. BRD67]
MSFVANPLQQLLRQGRTALRPEDIKAYGVQRFTEEYAARGPLPIPNLHFTQEDNQRMDQLLADERQKDSDVS